MLVEFGVENFKSFKEEVVLSMLASSDSSLKDNVIPNAVKEDSLLKSAAIYGANASGKTNLVSALVIVEQLVLKSQNNQSGQPMPFMPFKLDSEYLEKPTKMRIFFIHKGIKYRYGFSFNRTKVIEEYLYSYPNDRKSVVFERTNTVDFKFNTDRSDQEVIRKVTSENVLYLSKAAQNNYSKAQEALDWFRNGLRVIGPDLPELLVNLGLDLLKEDPTLKPYMLKALAEADLGITDFSTVIKSMPLEEFTKLSSNMPIEAAKFLMGGKNEMNLYGIKTLHKNVKFDFNTEESAGTKRLFGLIGFFVDSLRKGKVLVVDELDTRLHHKLNLFLVGLFHDTAQNKENAQLVFTTHNVNLMDLEIFRRDQIWFAKKSEKGDTELYSLDEFGERKDKDVEKAYLAGRYGAIPFITGNKVL